MAIRVEDVAPDAGSTLAVFSLSFHIDTSKNGGFAGNARHLSQLAPT